MASVDAERLNSAAIAVLYVEHADELRSFLRGVLRDPDLVGEVLQATFVKALESGHTSREETRKGWLFRVAYNEALLVRRRQKVEDTTYRKLAWRQPRGMPSEADHQLVRWEAVEQVREALTQLPPEQRRVVHMRIYEEKTFATIAEELSLPLGTVLTRMRLALKRLSKHLNE